jgi:hypothetical protein
VRVKTIKLDYTFHQKERWHLLLAVANFIVLYLAATGKILRGDDNKVAKVDAYFRIFWKNLANNTNEIN